MAITFRQLEVDRTGTDFSAAKPFHRQGVRHAGREVVGTQVVNVEIRVGADDGAADFLLQGSCRFALVEWREERAFAQRAETVGLRYNVASRIDGYNISTGRAISIAIFRSEGTE